MRIFVNVVPGRVHTHSPKRGTGFSGSNKSNPPAIAVGPGGPRGTRGFIFPWLRFNFTALIWLRVFVRVSNDLQRRCLCANLAPCCFSCLPVFFSPLFTATPTLRVFRPMPMNKNSIFFCLSNCT